MLLLYKLVNGGVYSIYLVIAPSPSPFAATLATVTVGTQVLDSVNFTFRRLSPSYICMDLPIIAERY